MSSRLLAYFDLVRLPNLFTAAADVLAGFFLAGGLPADWPITVRLCIASMCLYAGGVALNDVCDATRDAVQRPERPIPSGRVSKRTAFRLAWLLLAFGVLLAATVSARSVVVAALICLSIVLYNDVLKGTLAAPCLMGACRALNLALGMLPAATLLKGQCLHPIVLYGLYVAFVTFFALNEAAEVRPRRLLIGCIGAACVVARLTAWIRFRPVAHNEAVLLGLVLFGMVVWTGFGPVRSPRPRVVQAAVKRLVILMVVFDACLAWEGGGPVAALIVASLLVPTILLARRFRVT